MRPLKRPKKQRFRRGPPPPPPPPTDDQINLARLAGAIGYSEEQARNLVEGGVSKARFAEHYASAYHRGADEINAQVATTMLSMALDRTHKNCALAGIFWLKSRLGWQMQDIDLELGLFGGKRIGKTSGVPTRFTLRIGDRGPGDGNADIE